MVAALSGIIFYFEALIGKTRYCCQGCIESALDGNLRSAETLQLPALVHRPDGFHDGHLDAEHGSRILDLPAHQFDHLSGPGGFYKRGANLAIYSFRWGGC